eukprot:CAMPEP_0168789190 /NCGR_PEP_ID=MMETSP0725-20121227/12723_1 /TAXON_ID=265536 /ORGANISM="Amphiprora sp., Strain CCMP467" /LENGTH=1231 /DNA_ID=CAMNT_0008839489 /DNA_START=20 /DNA_END=3715 /DNA_ORIENTATION=+
MNDLPLMKRWNGLLVSLLVVHSVTGNPLSKPYIPFRTDPRDNDDKVEQLDLPDDSTRSTLRKSKIGGGNGSQDQCPLSFSLGISKRWHDNLEGPSINNPPIIRTVFPAAGPGKQVVYLTQYEHLDLLSPAMYENNPHRKKGTMAQEALLQAPDFPLLWESSSFHSSPLVHDVNGDGIQDVIVADYDGGLTMMGLAHNREEGGGKTRYFHHAQAPRLHIRRDWVETRIAKEAGTFNESDSRDPYHSYFEYYYQDNSNGRDVLRGISANVLDQDHSAASSLQQRRSRRVSHDTDVKDTHDENSDSGDSSDRDGDKKEGKDENTEEQKKESDGRGEEEIDHRRLQEEDDPLTSNTNDVEQAQKQSDSQTQEAGEEKRGGDEKPELEAQHEVSDTQPLEKTDVFNETEKYATDPLSIENVGKDSEINEDNSQTQVHQTTKNEIRGPEAHHDRSGENEETSGKEPSRDEVTSEQDDMSDPGHEENIKQEKIRQELERRHEEMHSEPVHVHRDGEHGDSAEQEKVDDAAHREDTDGGEVDVRQQLEQKNHESMDMQQNSKEDIASLEDVPTEDDMFREDDEMLFPKDDDYAMDRDLDEEADDLKDDLGETDSDEDTDDPYYGRDDMMDDEYGRYSGYDDYYGDGEYEHDDFYDDKHYIRIPPHFLSTPVLAEIPQLYGDHNLEDFVLVAASYFFDEDEYEGKFSYKRFTGTDRGDETEVERGQYVASVILSYTFEGVGRWSSQTHLDLTTDFTAPENATLVGMVPIRTDTSQMGAFALCSPTVADIDGDGTMDVLIGTSMGLLYLLDARNLYKRDKWPIQMNAPIETQPLVEDVLGDTNLEIFVMDTAGNVVCLGHDTSVLWNRNIPKSLGFGPGLDGFSPMTLGDVNGDGYLDLVVTVKVDNRWIIFAFDASSGRDIKNFPLELGMVNENESRSEGGMLKIKQPLLVDLHANQDHILEYIRRNSSAFVREGASILKGKDGVPQGGAASGLHIVQPVSRQLHIVEAGSGCTQKVLIGDDISSMVQVDDIHGTNRLDLLVSTGSGNMVTLESSASYHPLNTWSGGQMRGRNSQAHGYSASQGIYIHEVSRQYTDVFGVYVPVTFEIFDNRPGIQQAPEKQKYNVEVRDGSSSKRSLHKNEYTSAGVYTEMVYVRYGPGFYTLCVVMSTSNGLSYEDCFATGYNVHFMTGFGAMLWLPLILAALTIFMCGVKKTDWSENTEEDEDRDSHHGFLGRALPT